MILNFQFLTLFSLEFIDQASLKLSDNPINLHYSYSYLNNLNYSKSVLKSEYYLFLYLFHFQKMNTICIFICFKITICSNSDFHTWSELRTNCEAKPPNFGVKLWTLISLDWKELLTKFKSLKSSTGRWLSHQKVKIFHFLF